MKVIKNISLSGVLSCSSASSEVGRLSLRPAAALSPPCLPVTLNWWRDDAGEGERGEESSCGSLRLQNSVISMPNS